MSDILDLDINNYKLDEILDLFKLPYNFTEEHLKHTKKMVLMMHPDKSKLDKKYFLFYSSAYKIIYDIYKVKNKKQQNYSNKDIEYVPEKNKIAQETEISKFSKSKNFNKMFNKIFEENKIKVEDEEGYDDWLKDTDNIEEHVVNNIGEMNAYIEKKKNDLKAIIQYNGLKELETGSGVGYSDLLNKKPDNYGTNEYSDLRQAYTESVIPVTKEDYDNKKKYNSVDEFLNDRHIPDTVYNDETQKSYYARQKETEDKDNVARAYEMAKQYENLETVTKKINSQFLSLM